MDSISMTLYNFIYQIYYSCICYTNDDKTGGTAASIGPLMMRMMVN